MNQTVVIQIGNSDNKLTQLEWADYCEHMRSVIQSSIHRTHFEGGSSWDAPWQNACWVCEILDGEGLDLINSIIRVRKLFNQDSVAFMVGTTEFI